jgi:dTDP-4-amino-4,6-dideoxygalactose transaminase
VIKNTNTIRVTQPTLPSLDEFIPYLEKIWESKWLTNNGQFHQQLEKELAKFLGVKYLSLFANGTLALVTALKALDIKGEVITTPYSFVATAHAILWNNIKPVFVDVDPIFGNLDPHRIQKAISPNTAAILPVHVYGHPAEVEAIQDLADTNHLKVIYDAAHAFGVNYKGQSLLNYGDLSILSFHATKVFNTLEGGAIICKDANTKKHIDFLKNFGFAGETRVVETGINAKMNEIQAAFGLLQLKNVSKHIEKRRQISECYHKGLKDVKGIRLLAKKPDSTYNYSYYPIFIDEITYGMSRDKLYEKLKKNGIFGRRYFYPLVTEFPMYQGLDSAEPSNMPNAHTIASQVICLPIYPNLPMKEAERIIEYIKNQNA